MNKFLIIKIISVVIAAFSQILLKKSADNTYGRKIDEYLNGLVIIGYGLFFCSSIFGVISLRGLSLSYSSIIESLSYILVPVLSYFLLKERISNKQYLGMIIIILGIIVFNI